MLLLVYGSVAFKFFNLCIFLGLFLHLANYANWILNGNPSKINPNPTFVLLSTPPPAAFIHPPATEQIVLLRVFPRAFLLADV